MAAPVEDPGISGKRFVPLMFIGFLIFTVVGLFGTFVVGRYFEPISKHAYQNLHR